MWREAAVNAWRPNPRLQRTRFALLRSPLSRKPLGAAKSPGWWRSCLFALLGQVLVAGRIGALSTTIDSYGLYRDLPDGTGVELVRQAETVEVQMHMSLGFHFTTSGLRAGEQITLRKVVVHPEMHLPDGSVETTYTRELNPIVRSDGSIAGFQGFGFDHPYEVVSGQWTIEVWYGDQKLAAKTFTVTKPKRKN